MRKDTKKKIDWIAIKNEFCFTVKSVREISRQFSCQHTTITRRAKKESWQRPAKPAPKHHTTKTASTKVTTSRKPGAPTPFSPEFSEIARFVSAEGIVTDAKLAKVFRVHKNTVKTWRKDFPEFATSIRRGSDVYSCDVAEKSLLKRVTGFEYNEKIYEIVYVPALVPGPNGEEITVPEKRLIRIVTKYYPPETKATLAWLTNRDPDRWKNKQEVSHGLSLPEILESLPPSVANVVKAGLRQIVAQKQAAAGQKGR